MEDSTKVLAEASTAKGLSRHFPRGQFGRYLLVGIWNTAFGYAMFAFFTSILDKLIPHSYLAGTVLSNLVSITVAFFGYKWFVFKTKGNYLKEWGRCVGVYIGSITLTLFLLPILVFSIRHNFGYQKEAPYIAGAILTGLTVVLSFFGHRHISFRQSSRSG